MLDDLRSALRPTFAMTLAFALLLGLAYPLALTGIGQLAFPYQANGSLVRDGDKAIGSVLIGQPFASDRYFHSRPSAAGSGYDAMASAGSNLGPTSKVLADRITRDANSLGGHVVPSDLITASASGLDPHISLEAAAFQIGRIAKARHVAPAALASLIGENSEHPLLGFLGEPRVNVLMLNRALDAETVQP